MKIQPQDHKAKICLWADLTVSDLDELEESWISPERVKQALSRIFNLENGDDLKTGILLDLYFYTLQFAKENKFSKEQTSALFSMVKQTHEICVETPFENVMQCFQHFREQVLCHAVKRPPYSIDLFGPEEVRKITEYVINTYFRHYKMYKYAFTPLVRLDLTMNYTGMPPTPPQSIAGDEGDQALGEGEDGKTEGGEDGVREQEGEKQPEEEESPAAKELRAMIKTHLEEEVKKLRLSMDEQLKESEEVINKKLAAVEGTKTPAGKGGRNSGKGKKK
ncbi:cilia- and flagella-associated protein 119-like isoform X2 [Lineus longissimus]|uniref:cilia- and flagella-associated protein 119-like isoform X2 n=1 Tax=Lineus longissimus TaxID=88925 RepID=UPI00315D4586